MRVCECMRVKAQSTDAMCCVEIIYDRSRHTSSDTREGPPARHRDPAGNVLRSPVVVEEMKENVEPTHDKATSPIHWTGQLPASKVFTVTGCPRTADRGSHSALVSKSPSYNQYRGRGKKGNRFLLFFVY